MKKVSEKMGIKTGMRSLLIKAEADVVATIDYPELDLKTKLVGDFDYIHFFVTKSVDFHKQFPKLAKHLRETGMLWVSWPKAGQNNTELHLATVIKLGYDYGLVESKSISVDATWSALKFTHPKKGKVYNNSYGKLREDS
ncbi:uridine phosphorylase [Flavobacterium arsenatis]|uniref:Uridine phosphorylase n=1 Tax=Flavobacterium arsenatis TaxID=1484332 RepID=A0ABU1TL65_9FLAO|nr:hypothetical protein [Flavobacterium arsenatis]MDR6966718.1 uridine phosphorylase [Flavobacterium arsenatis]